MTKLFVSDLDGTLLQSDTSLTPRAFDELSIMLEAGLPFTVASARSIVSMRMVLGELPLALPIIEYNGGFLTDFASQRHIFCRSIPERTAALATEIGFDAGLPPFVSTCADGRDKLYPPEKANDGMRWYLEERYKHGDSRLQPVGLTDAGLAEEVVCLTFIGRKGELAGLIQRLDDQVAGATRMYFNENEYDRGWWWLTVHALEATKAHAIEELGGSLGIDIEEVTVFGDNVNDIPMFEAAGWAVAVENAVDELKVHADEIIGPNTADSVVDYIAARWQKRA